MMAKYWLVFLMTILIGIPVVILLLPGSAEGRTWYVDDDGGGDFERIQDAINASGDGDEIRVWKGIYYENVVVNKTVSLVGNGSANTTIDGGGAGDVVRIEGKWVNLSGFGIQNSGDQWDDAGIKVQSNNTTIMGNTISNNVNGIYLDSSSKATIRDNKITSNNDGGIYLGESSDSTIIGNTISNNDDGIYLRSSSDTIITGNNITSNNDDGIYLDSSNNTTITNNTYSNNYSGIWLYKSDYNILANNTCSLNNGDGISIRSSVNNIISYNYLLNNGNGIYLWGSYHNLITNNTISGNLIGIFIEKHFGNTTISYNNIYNSKECGIDAYNITGFTVNAKYNWWGDSSGPFHVDENPNGNGDIVTRTVDIDPWLKERVGENEEDKGGEDEDKKGEMGVTLGFYLLLFSIVFLLALLIVVMRLPDEYFNRRNTSKAPETEQAPPRPPQRLNNCPHCGGSFEVATQKRPLKFTCHFCGKEIEFE